VARRTVCVAKADPFIDNPFPPVRDNNAPTESYKISRTSTTFYLGVSD
jgi:hypothetical protein